MRRLPAPPCPLCGSGRTYCDAIEVPMSGDVPPYPVIPGTMHCLDCDERPPLSTWDDEARAANGFSRADARLLASR